MTKIRGFIKKETTFCIFLFILLFIMILYPKKIIKYPSFIDWKTIFSLSGLILITTALKESGYFYIFSKKMISGLKTERSLAFFLIGFSMLLSTFMTNDITLFIVVPITLSLKKLIKNDLSRFIILEAMAVNIGSSLTPIGNPQNLFIWHKWGIGFLEFVSNLLPLVLILSAVLLMFIFLIFKPKKIETNQDFSEECTYNKKLFVVSLFSLALYTFFISIDCFIWPLIAIFVLFALINYRIIFKTDWLIIAFFMVIFIDLRVISQIPFVLNLVNKIDFGSPRNVFLTSVAFSQFMSNVPASVFISKFSDNWLAISYGVNLAGNGFFIGSLANIIALRMANEKRIWVDFHRYSVVYFIITFALVYMAFFGI